MPLEPFYPLYSGSFFKEKQTNNSVIKKSFIVKNLYILGFSAYSPTFAPLFNKRPRP